MSGLNYSVTEKVIKGNKIARQLGYPTLNLAIPTNFPLKYGIYAGKMQYNNSLYNGIISIGITPHHPQEFPKLEIHIFDFNQNLYDKIITIIFIEFIRPEIKFSTTQDLIKQIQQDCINAKKILGKY